ANDGAPAAPPREQAMHPGRIFTLGERVLTEQPLNRMIDQDHLDVGLDHQRANERPGASHVEVLRAGAGVPAGGLVRVEEADVDVASRLVADVGAQVPTVLSADVPDV